jgi:hypothetical protein
VDKTDFKEDLEGEIATVACFPMYLTVIIIAYWFIYPPQCYIKSDIKQGEEIVFDNLKPFLGKCVEVRLMYI